jgi:hypothetical protein
MIKEFLQIKKVMGIQINSLNRKSTIISFEKKSSSLCHQPIELFSSSFFLLQEEALEVLLMT